MTERRNAPVPAFDRADRLKGMALVIVSSVGISFSGLAVRQIEAADAWQVNIYRPLSSALIVAIVLLFRYRGKLAGPMRDIGRPGVFGACLLAVSGFGFVHSITSTTVANTLFTLSAIPFVTALLAWLFLGERLNRVTAITMAVAAGGIAVMFVDGLGGGSMFGNAMALMTAVGFSGYAVIIRQRRRVDMLPAYLLSTVLICAVSLVVVGGGWRISWWDLAMCFIWGGLLSGVGNVLFVAATRYLYAAEVTLFMLVEFALGPIWVWWFIDEIPTIWTIAGGGLIMFAVAARTLYEAGTARRAARARVSGPV